CPRRTPSSRAAAEQAKMRPACKTAPGSSALPPAAITGQSGHHTASVRTALLLAIERRRLCSVLTSGRDRAVNPRQPHLHPLRPSCRTSTECLHLDLSS